MIKDVPIPAIKSEKVIRLSGDEEEIYFSLGELLERKGDGSAAKNALEEGFSRNNGSIKLFEKLMAILSREGALNEQKEYRERFCNIATLRGSSCCKPKEGQ